MRLFLRHLVSGASTGYGFAAVFQNIISSTAFLSPHHSPLVASPPMKQE
jgi:hypothetical protein